MSWSKKGLKGTLAFKGLNFGFECKKVKYLRLKFSSKGEFFLSIPYGYTQTMLYEFLQKNEGWIKKKKAEFEKKVREKEGKIEFLGKIYALQFDERVKKPFFVRGKVGANVRYELDNECAEFDENGECADNKHAKFDDNSKRVESVFDEFGEKGVAKENFLIARDEAQLKEFLRENARKICLFYVKKWRKHFDERILRVSVKTMTTRWGSCNSKKGYINLSTRLIHKPLVAIEYVILHELTHLKFPHHQASFYAHIERLMPDFKARERLLK